MSDWPEGMEPLLFCVDDDIDPYPREEVAEAVQALVGSRTWAFEPPVHVDEVDDEGTETVGGVLWMPEALSDQATRRSIEQEEALLADTEAVVAAVSELSARLGCEFAFELRGEAIGWVEAGVPDNSLTEGLLGEWRRVLVEQRAAED